jgi:formylglycine-generating enzyme required for sulfatase activity
MAKIAISYRRTDSDIAGRIFDRLVQRYGKDSVFRDIDNIPFGIDFREGVNDALRGTDALIAIVGPNWRGRGERGKARINDANDPVRIEVETALQRNILVIPALVGGARMPEPTDLPDSLQDFSFCNAANIDSGRNFDTDVERLMRSMDRLLAGKETRGEEATATATGIASLIGSWKRIVGKERVAERVKAPLHRMALIGIWLGVVAIGTVGIWAVFRLPTSILPAADDVPTPVRELAGEVPLSPERERALKPKDAFRECATCREMVVVSAGSFTMGSPLSEAGRSDNEGPPHVVTFARPFAVGRFAVTFDEWDACVADGGCNGYKPSDQGWGRGQRPVTNVSWDDAKKYAAWLSRKTGKTYRLLSEAEREYVTRAGTTTPFWWGSSISKNQANYDYSYSYGDAESESLPKLQGKMEAGPVDSFQPNPWGLYQVHGNVWEWVEDCWNESYQDAPSDGSVWTSSGDCRRRVLRGGSWSSYPQHLRSASRQGRDRTDLRDRHTGFRVGRTLTP